MRNFLDKILENVIANLIAAGVIAGLSMAIVFLRSQGIALTVSVSLNIFLTGACFWLLLSKIKNQTKAIPKYNLLPDPKSMTELNLDNSFLTEVYGKLHALALKWSDDARLWSFSVHVYPFRYYGCKILIYFRFFSSWAKQSRTWCFDEFGHIDEVGPPNHKKEEISPFSELPWMQFPNWLEMVKKAYIQIAPLPEAKSTCYWVQIDASLKSKWLFTFQDGVSGKQHQFQWTLETGLSQW